MKMEKTYVSYPVYRFEELNEKQLKQCKIAMLEHENDESEIRIKSYGGTYGMYSECYFKLICSDFGLMMKRIATAEEAIRTYNEIDKKMQPIVEELQKIIEENEP